MMVAMTAARRALIIGNSDGIGLGLTRRLLRDGWTVAGVSRSQSPVEAEGYRHVVCDVTSGRYPAELADLVRRCEGFDLCVYCAGIGEGFDPDDLSTESTVFAVNLMGALRTVEVVVSDMISAGRGHFIGLSSLADALVNPGSPSYSGSKAGLSCYLRGLAVALRGRGVHVTNLRFGFVETKMAKGPVRPMMISVDRAVEVVVRCVRKRPVQRSYPLPMAAAIGVAGWLGRLRIKLS